LGEHHLADPDRAVQDDRLAGEEVQGGQVPDERGRDLRVVAEVEVLDGGGGLEVGGLDPRGRRGGVGAGDLVFAEGLQKLRCPSSRRGLVEADVQVSSMPESPRVRRVVSTWCWRVTRPPPEARRPAVEQATPRWILSIGLSINSRPLSAAGPWTA
jgi:hypothetical protein